MRVLSMLRAPAVAVAALLIPGLAAAASAPPPQVFRNVNLVRNVNIEKSYVRETVNVVIENTDKKAAQDTYYVPFTADLAPHIGAFEARDRAAPDGAPALQAHFVPSSSPDDNVFYRISLPAPLAPAKQLTLTLSYFLLDALVPSPASIGQADKQYLSYQFSALAHSAYPTVKQNTKLKLATSDVPDATTIKGVAGSKNDADPVRQGNTLSYGEFHNVAAGTREPVSIRFDSTRPVNYVSTLERDVEVSHWGGNLAIEERYMLSNRGAALKENFDRIAWAAAQYYSAPTSALRELVIPLKAGSVDPYFIDDVGNVSTSHFRKGTKEARLELRPRYPVFGQWNYKFRIGWDQSLGAALRQLKDGDSYVLRVPFIEGPRNREGTQYEKVQVRVILPEGATNVRFDTRVPLVSTNQTLHRTFMDTVGRTALTLTAENLVDDVADRDLTVVYDYPFAAGLRKPVTILAAVFAVFAATYALSLVDVSIGRKS